MGQLRKPKPKAKISKERKLRSMFAGIQDSATVVKETAQHDQLVKRIRNKLDEFMKQAESTEEGEEGVIKKVLRRKTVTELVDFMAEYTSTTNMSVRAGLLTNFVLPDAKELDDKIEALTSCSEVIANVINFLYEMEFNKHGGGTGEGTLIGTIRQIVESITNPDKKKAKALWLGSSIVTSTFCFTSPLHRFASSLL